MRHTKIPVEVSSSPELPIGFIDRVDEVGQDDEDEDASTVFGEAGRAGSWLRVASADEDCVEGCLKVPSREIGEEVPASEGK